MDDRDPFSEIARYYDKIMDFVNYDRWFTITTLLAELLPVDFVHLDAACGTGTLLRKLRRIGWKSVGVDLSPGMIRAGRVGGAAAPAAVADLRTLPFSRSLDYVTCLFDSINFILDDAGIEEAFTSLAGVLKREGLLYFDIVTERMITQHFEDQEWTEDNGTFSTTWRSQYSHTSRVAETEIRVTKGDGGVFRERIYPLKTVEALVKKAGLTPLAILDAHNWKAPGKRSIRIDFIVAKDPSPAMKRQFKRLHDRIRERIA